MKWVFNFFIFFSVLQIFGCATQNGQPEWVSGSSSKYAKAQYLYGRGQASSVEDAKKRALADLAEVFQVTIAVNSEDVQSVKRNAGGEQLASESSRRINTSTEQLIRGVQIAEIWQSASDKNYHVLAVLQRQQAAAGLKQQIAQLEDAVEAGVQQSNGTPDLLVKVASLKKAIGSQLELEGLQKSLQIVNASGRSIESKYNSGRLKTEMQGLLAQIRISPKVLEGSAAGLAEVLDGALSEAGFMITAGEQSVYSLKASLKLTDIGKIEGWYWQRGNLEISLSDTATGRVRGAHRWPVKGSGRDRASAIRRALDEADTVLKAELRSTIIGMATGE